MKKIYLSCLRQAIMLTILTLAGSDAFATHIFGVDLYYTFVSGNTYTINMAIYGDCSAASATLNSLYNATPEVQIYNGTALLTTVFLNPGSPQGTEVTPVCASQINNTACSGGTIPGVRKFTYSYTVTLPYTSANWRFHYDGNMGVGNPQAGRSATISNVTGAGTTIVALDAKLNNVAAPNSSSVYTTIPTPFFCINKPANFNPGAVDPNGDSLSFALVPAINQAAGGSSVTYSGSYTATAPLAVSSGTFSFNTSTGQLGFTPNALQRSLIVYTVSEYRNGVLVGTSQREMTFVVLSCNNPPPTGNISNPSTTGIGVTVVDNTHLNACGTAGLFTFNIDPTDSNSTADITVSAAGLPSGATFNVANNNTTAPIGLFSWNTNGVAPGTYIFYITYQDDACPLSSKQTIAYTVNILPYPTNTFTLISAATCIKKAVFHVTPGGTGSPYTIEVIQGGTIIQTNTNITSVLTDSLSPGTYTVRVLNTNGCSADTTITIAPPIVITPTVTANAPFCPGGNNGSLSVTATGGLSPYTYALGSGTYTGTSIFSGLTPGNYTIHIKDANLCVKDTTVTVPDAPHSYFNAVITDPWCNFYTNGSISVSGSNTAGPYTYAFGAGAYSPVNVFSNLNIGTYIIHVKNLNGCITDTTITLRDSLAVSASLALTNVACYGGSSGVIAITAQGGFGTPYNYAFNANPYTTSSSFSNLAVGSYVIHVRDVNQCHFDTTVTLLQPAQIIVTPTVTNISCYGNVNGSIVVNTVGGTPSYSYTLNGALQAGNSYGPLAAGTYIIDVTDQNNCLVADTINLTQPAPVSINTVVVHNVSCNAGADGSFTISPSGGTTPYSYAVNTGTFSASNVLGGLSVGTYTVHIKDANGCTKDTIMSLTQPTVITPVATVKNSTCHTLANGVVTISATGGTPSYTYSNGGSYSASGIFASLPGGSYTFHVKDANGCIRDLAVTVADSIIVAGSFAITEPLCNGQTNGVITVTGVGGTAPYAYANGANTYGSTNTFTGIAAGTYIIHVKDANGCIDDTSIAVAQPGIIVPTITITTPSCYGYHDGSILAGASGGTPIYAYALNGGSYATTSTFTTLGAGRDTIHIKDNNGCLHDTSFTVTQPSQLKIAGLAISEVKCFGDTSGSVTVTATGATPPYSYAADNGIFHASDVVTGLRAGTHVVDLKDHLGCLVDSSITITQPTRLSFRLDQLVNPTCFGYKDGMVKVDGAGGTSPYTYAIGTGTYSTQNSFTKLAEGQDTIYVQDKNNCIDDTVVTLTGYPHIVVDDVVLHDITCYGAASGSIQLTVTGGKPPLSYTLGSENASATSTFDSLKANAYVIRITDSANCEKDTTLTLTQPDSLKIATTASPNECVGYDNMGAVTANVSGGTEPYTYLWNTDPAQTGNAITGMANGNYQVWVTDANGCVDSALTAVMYDDCCKPYIPNAFTPNGDGKDDLFRVVFKGDLKLENFSVYNRYGQRVYFTIYLDQGWDGTYNGVPQDMDTYFYYFKGLCGNKGDHEIEMHGDVTLIR